MNVDAFLNAINGSTNEQTEHWHTKFIVRLKLTAAKKICKKKIRISFRFCTLMSIIYAVQPEHQWVHHVWLHIHDH